MTPYTSNIYLSTSLEFLCTIHFKFDLKKTEDRRKSFKKHAENES